MRIRVALGLAIYMLSSSISNEVEAGVFSRLQNNRGGRGVATVAYSTPNYQYVQVAYTPPAPVPVAAAMVAQVPDVTTQFREVPLDPKTSATIPFLTPNEVEANIIHLRANVLGEKNIDTLAKTLLRENPGPIPTLPAKTLPTPVKSMPR